MRRKGTDDLPPPPDNKMDNGGVDWQVPKEANNVSHWAQ